MKNWLVCVLFTLSLLSCGSGLDRYYSYTFVEYQNPNDLIDRIKEFKSENAEYDIFESKDNQSVSIDTIINNGAYDVQDINFYLPTMARCVYCSIIPNSHNDGLYVIGYRDLKKVDTTDLIYSNMLGNPVPISRSDNSKDIRRTLEELELILNRIGTMKKEY